MYVLFHPRIINMFCVSPNITNWSPCCSDGVGPTGSIGSTGPTGPTGFTGPTGPVGNSFDDQGFSVALKSQTDIVASLTLVPFDEAIPSRGGYNTAGWYNYGTSTAFIPVAGTYIVTCMVDYIHDLNPSVETVTVSIYRNGLGGQVLCRNNLFYGTPSNDNETLVCVNTVKLSAGDSLQVYLFVPFSSNQSIGGQSRFSCQRIA
jgi:hypothetical protein